MRPRLYRLAADVAALDTLAASAVRGRARARSFAVGCLAFAALLVLVNVLTTSGEPELAPAERLWSLIPVLVLAVLVAVFAVHQFRIRPRAIEAQRRLRDHLEVLKRSGAVRRAEGRLGEALGALSPRRPELEGMLAALRRESTALVEGLTGEGAAGSRRGSSEHLAKAARKGSLALLEGYGVAQRNMEVDALLEPGFHASEECERALGRALGLLKADKTGDGTVVVRPVARHSIAVLPFSDLSGADERPYFGDGLAEDLIHALTRIDGLRVIARGSAFTFRERDADVREIGRRLRVETVVEGSVRRAGDRIRVTVGMVRVADGLQIWSERYERGVDDIFAVQDEITEGVVSRLRQSVLAGASGVRGRQQTGDVEAYHLYLRGRHLWGRRTPADLAESIGYFEQALERDPDYALAHAGIADAFDLLGYYSVVPPAEAFPRASEAARRALELDAELAEAHCSLAFARLLYDWDWGGAEAGFARTFELNPGYATAHHWYAECLAFQGRHEEAIEQARAALALDPLSLIIHVLVGWSYYYARRYEEAIESLRETLTLDPDFAPAEFWLGLACERLGRPQEAERALSRAIELSGRSPFMLASLGSLYSERGEEARARELLGELAAASDEGYVPWYHLAALRASLGETESALEALERALDRRENWLVFLNIDPVWDRLREEARFRALVRQVGLDPATASGARRSTHGR